jgi:general secretion pathway protein G
MNQRLLAQTRQLRASCHVVRRSLDEDGFTLIELLTVISIIGILAAIIVGTFGYAHKKAFISRTKAEIAAMENGLEAFKIDNGYYPQRPNSVVNDIYSSTNIYNALAGGPKVYMNFPPRNLKVVIVSGVPCTNIVDAAGVYYRYLCPGTNNPVGFDLWSFGPDGTNGTVAGVNHDLDNITNWQQ